MGDMNAKVGESEKSKSTGTHGLGIRNDAGERLIEFCEENDMKIMNTFFKQPKRRLYTWTSPDGVSRNQIDYIIIQNRWRSTIHATHTLPGADCGTDHEILVAGLRLKLKKLKKEAVPARYDMEKISSEYSVAIKNRFSALDLLEREPEKLWTDLKEAVLREAQRNIPKLGKRSKSPWISESAIEIAGKRRQMKAAGAKTGDLQKYNAMFQRQIRKDKVKHISDMCAKMEKDNQQGKTRDLFKKVKEITGNFTPRIGGLKNTHGKNLLEDSAIKQKWKEYTEDLYKRDCSVNVSFVEAPHDLEPSVTQAEVRKALYELKNNKSPGSDNIPAELLKACGEEGVLVLTTLCQRIWESGIWPKDWKRTVYIPIPKKGDPRECANNRTIALISHASKVLLKVIQGRMEKTMERELPDVQAGFRKKRGTRDQIANMRWIMERAREYNQKLYFCFIDYSKAFDCVDHNILWNSLREMGFAEHLIILLRNLYDGQQATVRTECGDTDPFGIGKGVRQGCILSPILFNLYAEKVMRDAGLDETEEGIRIGGRNLNNLRYADDVTLAANTEDGLVSLIEKVTCASGKAGLYLNIQKTKVMSTAELQSFSLNNKNIEVVDHFNLLGSILEEEGSCKQEIVRRLALGRTAMCGLAKIWKDRDFPTSTKVRLVKALVFPVATYGAETWTTDKKLRTKIGSFEMWCWRKMLRIPWTARRTNASVIADIGEETSLENKIAKLKLEYFGHVVRADGLEKSIMLGMGDGHRNRGRPRRRWLEDITELTGLRLQELKMAARDRRGWREMVRVVTRGCSRPD
jgi:hypothetical protein